MQDDRMRRAVVAAAAANMFWRFAAMKKLSSKAFGPQGNSLDDVVAGPL